MKIRAIIPSGEGNASSFWRITQPFVYLKEKGHDATYHFHDNLNDIDFSGALVVIHRVIPSDPKAYVKQLYKKGARCVVYSIDDYIVNPRALRVYIERSGGHTTQSIDEIVGRVREQIAVINECEHLIVTTYELANMCADYVDVPITVLDNSIDHIWFEKRLVKSPYQSQENVYIGWAGGRRPEYDFQYMVQAWKRISKEFDHVWFVLAGYQHDIIDRHIDLDRKVRIPFKSLDEWPASMQVDIGCCALDTYSDFNNGKSPIKWLEYSLAGAATVCSPLVYDRYILDRVNSYIANGPDEWYDKLKALVLSAVERQRIQHNAQYDIHRTKTLARNIGAWEFQFERMLG